MRRTIRNIIAPGTALAAILAGGTWAIAAQAGLPAAVTGSITACVNTRSRVVTQPPAGHRCPSGTFSETWNKQGPAGLISSSSTTLQDPSATALSVTTGGSFNTNSAAIGTVPLKAGTYLVTFSAKATPNDSSLATGTQVFPQFFIYDQVKNPSFAGDLFNVGAGALEPTSTNHDSYYSGSTQLTLTGSTTLHFYAFGYDSDSGAGTYALDQAVFTATRLQVG